MCFLIRPISLEICTTWHTKLHSTDAKLLWGTACRSCGPLQAAAHDFRRLPDQHTVAGASHWQKQPFTTNVYQVAVSQGEILHFFSVLLPLISPTPTSGPRRHRRCHMTRKRAAEKRRERRRDAGIIMQRRKHWVSSHVSQNCVCVVCGLQVCELKV